MIKDPVFAEMLGSEQHHPHENSSHIHGKGPGRNHAGSSSHTQGSHSHGFTPTASEKDLAQDKVRSILRSFVRDWAGEGADERDQCYAPCLSALEEHWKGRRDVKVLVPGCGLGRLAMEIAAKGQPDCPSPLNHNHTRRKTG